MNTLESCLERVRRALTVPTSRAIVGLVDELLAVSRHYDLRLEWKAGNCHIEFDEGGQAKSIEIPFRKSVFRAALARVSVMCSEAGQSSVSPYGGEGELRVGRDPGAFLHARFVNSTDEQSLVLTALERRPGQQTVSQAPEQTPIHHDVAGHT